MRTTVEKPSRRFVAFYLYKRPGATAEEIADAGMFESKDVRRVVQKMKKAGVLISEAERNRALKNGRDGSGAAFFLNWDYQNDARFAKKAEAYWEKEGI